MSLNFSLGVGVLIIQDGKLLAGRRKRYVRPETGREASGAGKLSLPGGSVEIGETFVQAAVREAKEETGLVIRPFKWDGFRHDLATTQFGNRLTIYVPARVVEGALSNVEPEKHEDWRWFSIKDLYKHEDENWMPVKLIWNYSLELGLDL